MAAIDFPAAPVNQQLFAAPNGISYRYVTPPGIWTVANGPADTIIAADTPPANPIPNQLWWHSSLGQLFIFYFDGTSSQWVPANPTAAQPAPPPDSLRFYAETVLSANASTVEVAVPVNPKRLELQFVSQCVGSIDGSLFVQGMVGSTAIQTGYVNQTIYALNTAIVAAGNNSAAGLIGLGLVWFSGTIRLIPSPIGGVGTAVYIGDWVGWGQDSAVGRYVMTQGFVTNLDPLTTNRFRLVNSGFSPLFMAGSLLRSYAVF